MPSKRKSNRTTKLFKLRLSLKYIYILLQLYCAHPHYCDLAPYKYKAKRRASRKAWRKIDDTWPIHVGGVLSFVFFFHFFDLGSVHKLAKSSFSSSRQTDGSKTTRQKSRTTITFYNDAIDATAEITTRTGKNNFFFLPAIKKKPCSPLLNGVYFFSPAEFQKGRLVRLVSAEFARVLCARWLR